MDGWQHSVRAVRDAPGGRGEARSGGGGERGAAPRRGGRRGGAGPGRGGKDRQPRGGGEARAMESGGALNGSAAASGRFAAVGTAALGALMALLIAVTVAGNALVMLAFVADSSLRTQNNFFLLNLAISDFLVGKVPPVAEQRARNFVARAAQRGAVPLSRPQPRVPSRSAPPPPAPQPRSARPHPAPGAAEPWGAHGRRRCCRSRPRVSEQTEPSGCRCLLHSFVRALCADREMDLREKPLQTLAGS